MSKTTIIVLGAIFLAVSACTKAPEQLVPAKASAFPKASNLQDCRRLEGKWVDGRGAVPNFCIVPTSDGGRQCNDHSECQSFCVANPARPPDSEKIGVCRADYQATYSCFNMVEDGVIHRLCMD
jgi:hypothetical protein